MAIFGGIMQRIKLALVYAVTANHATGIIDGVRVNIDAGCFAVALALAAVLALVGIDGHLEV